MDIYVFSFVSSYEVPIHEVVLNGMWILDDETQSKIALLTKNKDTSYSSTYDCYIVNNEYDFLSFFDWKQENKKWMNGKPVHFDHHIYSRQFYSSINKLIIKKKSIPLPVG
jgi:hypothetical protein